MMKNLFKFLSVILLGLYSCQEEIINETQISEFDLSHKKINSSKTTVDVINPIQGEVVGSATLHRNSNGLTFNYNSNALTPGYTYTVWWVIWNEPEKCGIPGACNDTDFAIADMVEVDVMNAGGHVIGNNGKGNFGGHLNAGDDSGSVNDLFGLPAAGGLQEGKTFSAEVHLVLRSHGPAISGEVSSQISSYTGGCNDPFAFPPFTEIPDEIGECGDIEFAIFPPAS